MVGNSLTTINYERRSWIEKANCRGANTNDFFDIEYKTIKERQTIIKLCEECEVRKECKAFGEHIKPESAMYGGVYFRGRQQTHPLKVRYKRKNNYA